jgi:hypothetical protein
MAAQTDRIIRLRDGHTVEDAHQRPRLSEQVAV